ncbi:carbonic anhydrase [Amphibiibacter pelophylacis]|uniref:Carbonic anhydrase family protein n=1 Tax=Amphibiibacter pelophylacis TaxID=1799477 RepID=A0ACC6P5U7_9BURK
MKKLLIPTLTVCAALLAGCAAMSPQGLSHGAAADTPAGATAGKPVHWGYSGHAGPEHWAEISPEFGSCNGKNQSPINLTRFVDAKLAPLNPVYQAGGQSIINNGHTVQINYAPGSFITVDGDRYELKQFHFHEPSENHIDGKAYPLEMHLVHADSKGNLAVIAVMFEEGAENPALDAFWNQLPMEEGPVQALKAPVNVATLLPTNPGYYRYNGSLTTPPCSEGVRWLVMKTPLTASKAQLAAFAHAMKDSPDNRPLQPLNARSVLR